jgi:aminomethyltransferase
MQERGIPRKNYLIVDAEGNTIGEVSSGTMSPSLDKAIGMGYVKKEFSKVGTEIFIQIRNKQLKAEVVKLPFYKA